ncbi:MAG: sulfurtransferase, partial [Alphaproteobacteria bacterium]
EHHVVVYDAHGIFSAPRVWWTFRVFGHDRVSVLDGGLPKWQREGRAVEAGHRDVIPARYRPTFRPELVRTLAQMQANLVTGVATVVDARPPGRFRGTEPEPRAGLRGGHIPGSVNVISSDLVDPETGTLVDRNRMRHVFAAGGTPVDEPLIATCGSGVAASVLALGLHLLGHDEWAVYDGSWTEWGGRDDTPVEV